MRQFLALELSQSTREGIGRLAGELEGRLRGWRWSRPEAMHLTLRFLGDVPADVDERARPLWAAAAAGIATFAFTLEGLGSFPPSGRPRTLWLGVHEATGRLPALHAALEAAAVRAGLPAEARPFHPHLTLGRARARAQRPDPRGHSGRWIESATRIVLFQSLLGPHGARYTALAVFPLQVS